VKALLDQNAACVRTRLGRYVYGPVSTHCANSILNPLLLLLTLPRDPLLTTNQDVTGDVGLSGSSVVSVAQLGSSIAGSEAAEREQQMVYQRNPAESFRKLWDSLR
jgi:hypothetical protein